MKELPVRKNIRLEGYDYSKAGYYFVTMCVKDRSKLFGKIVGTTAPGRPVVELTALGICVHETMRIAAEKGTVDKYIVMPNHVHLIVVLPSTTDDRGRSSLQQTVRNIKSFVTKYAGFPLWQPRFYDHIIRNEAEYQHIWQYIDENPARWQEDCYFTESE